MGEMQMPRRSVLLAASFAAFTVSGGALAAGPAASLPPGWSHAEINVTGAGGRAHTLIYDRGRVQALGVASLTLRERDGSVVTVAVAPRATVLVNGRPGTLVQVRAGDHALTRGTDGRPVTLVRATRPR
jgi:hypothetical protein